MQVQTQAIKSQRFIYQNFKKNLSKINVSNKAISKLWFSVEDTTSEYGFLVSNGNVFLLTLKMIKQDVTE